MSVKVAFEAVAGMSGAAPYPRQACTQTAVRQSLGASGPLWQTLLSKRVQPSARVSTALIIGRKHYDWNKRFV